MNIRARVAVILFLVATASVVSADDAPRAAIAREHFRASARTYGLGDPDRELRERSVRTDARGYTHIRYDQFHEGVRVFEGEAIAHVDRCGRVKVTNALRGNLRVDTTPRISEATAVATVVNAIAPRGEYTTRSELKVFEQRLTWHVTLFNGNAIDELAQWEYFVDAHSGAVAASWDGTHRSMVAGTAKTMLSGDHPMDVDLASDGRYYLQDSTRGNIYTLDMLSGAGLGPVISSDTSTFGDNQRTDCSGNPNRVTAGADAQFALAATWDYLQTTFGRNGINGAGGQVHARVHYGSCTNNAVWSVACNCAQFSDGTTGNYLPFVSIDVVAHEFGHGFMQSEANLTTRGESAALNESNSDIIGTLVEHYVAGTVDAPDYWLGERLIWSNYSSTGDYTQTAAIRYMDDPRKDGRSAVCWSRNMKTSDPHTAGGPNNHMFYLLSEGGTSKCNGSVVTGIGRAKAAAIWYKAVTDYMTSSTDYAAARIACLDAAAALYGPTSPEWAAVNAAYAAVNVK